MNRCGVPISGTKPEDVQVLNMVEWVPNEGTPHGHMHFLLHEVMAKSWDKSGHSSFTLGAQGFFESMGLFTII